MILKTKNDFGDEKSMKIDRKSLIFHFRRHGFCAEKYLKLLKFSVRWLFELNYFGFLHCNRHGSVYSQKSSASKISQNFS